jgi:hypothetical protein
VANVERTERLDRLAPRPALRFLAEACRGEYARLAPDLVWGLQHPSADVAAEAAQCLIDLGSPGLRAAWAAYEDPGLTDEQRRRLESFLLRNADWLFERLFAEFRHHPEPDAVRRRARLWAEPALRNRLLAHVEGGGDAWLARTSRAILESLEAQAADDPGPPAR